MEERDRERGSSQKNWAESETRPNKNTAGTGRERIYK